MAGPSKPKVTRSLFSLQELPSGDPKEEPFQGDQCPLEGKSRSPDLTCAPSIWPKPALSTPGQTDP